MPLSPCPSGQGERGFPAPFAGIDEAGRGCLAGPVAAAAVILPPGLELPGLDDSKKLSAARREELAPLIRSQALAWGIGLSWPVEIDRVNILQATFLAMSRAVSCLRLAPASLAVDGDKVIPPKVLAAQAARPGFRYFRDARGPANFPPGQYAVVGGDALVPAISAASVLAKTFRDRLMASLDRRWPGFGLAGHKGYGTAAHLKAIRELGPSPTHRKTFRGVRTDPPTQEQSCLPGI